MSSNSICYIKRALLIVTEKPAPDRIPLSDPDRLRARDYYTAMFQPENDERGFLVDSLLGNAVAGRWVSQSHAPEPAVVNLPDLKTVPLEIHQYLGQIEIVYTSPREFVLHHFLQFSRFKLICEILSQWFYTRKLLLRAERMDILRNLVEREIQERNGASTFEMMNELHGDRWPLHPQGWRNHQYTELLLDSLVETSDIEKRDSRYRVKAKSIQTIIAHDVEDRRHQANSRLQRSAVGLTVILIVIGGIQAYAAIIQAKLGDQILKTDR